MNRLYAVESGLSLTGAAADHRLPLQSTRIPAFVEILEHELAAAGGKSSHDESSDPVKKFAHAVAGDLLDKNHLGRSAVCIGEGQPPEAHAAVHRINALLGNVGKDKPISYTQVPDPRRPSNVAAIRELVDEMQAGNVGALLILGGNPVYDAPVDLDFGGALEKVETSLHLSTYRDETSRQCMWHLPRAHFLESWGDGRAYDGTYSVVQPMIAPLRNGRSAIELLSYILAGIGEDGGKVTEPRKLVQQTFKQQIAGSSKANWQQVLRDGLAAGSKWPVESVSKPAPAKQAVKAALPGDDQLEVVFRRDASVYDGRFANNSWLQELPDPITKMTWGNAALLSPATAEKLGVKNETISVLKVGERTVRIPVYVLPGQAAGSISLPLGYGRTSAGSVGGNSLYVEPVGVDVYPLRTTDAMHVATGVSLE
ncbi:MAG: molybdopterin oxidoreductase, partial [Planctomycetota bacterium]|nr:molybdopterin oxidoreductase [Planctomycetota bacterium]